VSSSGVDKQLPGKQCAALVAKGVSQFFFACLSVCISAAPTGRIFVTFYIGDFLRKSIEKPQAFLTADKNIGHFARRLKSFCMKYFAA
jgi:hypothetical protein